jgi:excisionase family DNA binding protein
MQDYLTTEEVAAELRTTPGTVRWWHSVGRGPKSVKPGRRRLYLRSDVDAYVRASRPGGLAAAEKTSAR